MPSRCITYYWQSENGNFAVSSMDLLRNSNKTVVGTRATRESGSHKEINITMPNYTSALAHINRPRRPECSGSDDGRWMARTRKDGVTENAVERNGTRMAANSVMLRTGESGDACIIGEGDEDSTEAFKWFMQAAQQGIVPAELACYHVPVVVR